MSKRFSMRPGLALRAAFFVNAMIGAGARVDTMQGRANFDSYGTGGNVAFRF